MTTGHCKHGEFELLEGCEKCIAERRQREVLPGERPSGPSENRGIKGGRPLPALQIIKVKYFSETTGELSGREYTYFSADRLNVGDIVIVPVRDTTGKAKVSAIDVPEAEIAAFKDKVKTIPVGSKVVGKVGQFAIEERTESELQQEIGIPYVMPEEMRGVKISPNAARLVDDIADKLSEGIADSFKEAVTETTLALRPGEDIEAHDWHSEAVTALAYALKRVIKTLGDAKMATDDLSIISRLKKAMEAKRKEKLAPHQAEVKAIQETYTYLMAPVMEAERITKAKQTAFLQEQERIRREQEEINRKRMEAAQQEMELKGELSESVNLVEVTEAPERVSTNLGVTGLTDHWVFEVIDFAQVTDEYKVIDGAMLNAIARKHHDTKKVAGIRFYNEPYLATRAR